MLSLSRPLKDQDEDDALLSILARPEFSPHATQWKGAYQDYRKGKGDPWALTPATFNPSIKTEQIALYDSKRRTLPLRRIRQTPGLPCCPMCGSPSIGTLDHYLPKEEYPEFAVLPSNLLPTCSLCNSGSKGRTYKGMTHGERFLHPYFDQVADKAFWHIVVHPPYGAPTFQPIADTDVDDAMLSMVNFHLREIFGETFHTHVATYWSQLPASLADHIKEEGKTLDQAWATELRWSSRTLGVNGWRAALIRGATGDPMARGYVESLLPQLTAPSCPA